MQISFATLFVGFGEVEMTFACSVRESIITGVDPGHRICSEHFDQGPVDADHE